MSHTYAVLDVSKACFDEIRRKLEAAGYGVLAFHGADQPEVIDMHGIGLMVEEHDTDEAGSTRRFDKGFKEP